MRVGPSSSSPKGLGSPPRSLSDEQEERREVSQRLRTPRPHPSDSARAAADVGEPATAAGVLRAADAAVERAAAAITHQAAVRARRGPNHRTRARRAGQVAADTGHAGAAARLTRGARAALNDVAAAVAGRATPDALRRARQRRALVRAAQAGPLRTADLAGGAEAAVDLRAAAITLEPAVEALHQAASRSAGTAAAAHARHAATTAGLGHHAGAAVEGAAAAIALLTAGEAERRAGRGHALATAADVGRTATAAGLR